MFIKYTFYSHYFSNFGFPTNISNKYEIYRTNLYSTLCSFYNGIGEIEREVCTTKLNVQKSSVCVLTDSIIASLCFWNIFDLNKRELGFAI